MKITTTFPLTPAIGHTVFDTATNRLLVWDGNSWKLAHTFVARQIVRRSEVREQDEQRMLIILCGVMAPMLALISIAFSLWWVLP